MEDWIPLVLQEQEVDANYSECECPKCGFESVHHMGVPCQHHSCPKCGELMIRKEEVKEGGMIKLPDGSGFFTGTVGKPKKKRKRLSESDLLETYLTYVQDSDLQEVSWQGVKDYFTKEKPMPYFVRRSIAAAKPGDEAFAKKVLEREREKKMALARTKVQQFQKAPAGSVPSKA